MPIIRNPLIPFGNFSAVNLFGLIFVKNGVEVTPRLLNHEKIHTRQLIELLIIPFYLIYIMEWLWKAVKYRDFVKAYRQISFKREAYSHDADLNYLKHRSHFAQWHE